MFVLFTRMRYKCWRAADGLTHVLCRFGWGNDPATDPFERLPERIRHMGPWTGSHEGDVSDLRTRYRLALTTEGFCIVHRNVTAFHREVETRRYVPAQR